MAESVGAVEFSCIHRAGCVMQTQNKFKRTCFMCLEVGRQRE